MPVDAVNALASPRTLVTDDTADNSRLDKEAFMKLLVAELRHQDPLDPMEAREMVTQLSELTSVEKLSTIEQRLAALEIGTAGMANTEAAGLLGRTVTAETRRMPLGELGPASGSFSLASPASEVSATIRDASGRVVRTLELGRLPAGLGTFEWDGSDDRGTRAAAGIYTVELAATDEAGSPIAISTEVTGLVSNISYEGGVPTLIVGDSRIMLGDIVSISQ